MYNAEKYISQCLGSVLHQTFQNYEILVIDDKSTDKSVSIVESLIPNFNGKLKLLKLKKNSGMVAIPRNYGIRYSRGKYLLFLDNDDIITNTALEELNDIAEQTQADVLHSEKYLVTADGGEYIDDNTKFKVASYEVSENRTGNRFSIVKDDIAKRVDDFINRHYLYNVWTKLFRRDFVVENNISFPEYPSVDDARFCLCCLILAKTYVRIPNIFYIWRERKDSVSHKRLIVEEEINRRVKIIVSGTKSLNDFLDNIDFFINNADYKYKLIANFIHGQCQYLNPFYFNVPIHIINEILYKTFVSCDSENAVLLSYLFNMLNVNRINLLNIQKQIYHTGSRPINNN